MVVSCVFPLETLIDEPQFSKINDSTNALSFASISVIIHILL